MVVTPQDARKYLSARDERKMSRLEKRIDKVLLEGKRTFGMNNVTYDRAVEALLHRYTEAGWKVNFQYDKQDGDYLEFVGGAR